MLSAIGGGHTGSMPRSKNYGLLDCADNSFNFSSLQCTLEEERKDSPQQHHQQQQPSKEQNDQARQEMENESKTVHPQNPVAKTKKRHQEADTMPLRRRRSLSSSCRRRRKSHHTRSGTGASTGKEISIGWSRQVSSSPPPPPSPTKVCSDLGGSVRRRSSRRARHIKPSKTNKENEDTMMIWSRNPVPTKKGQNEKSSPRQRSTEKPPPTSQNTSSTRNPRRNRSSSRSRRKTNSGRIKLATASAVNDQTGTDQRANLSMFHQKENTTTSESGKNNSNNKSDDSTVQVSNKENEKDETQRSTRPVKEPAAEATAADTKPRNESDGSAKAGRKPSHLRVYGTMKRRGSASRRGSRATSPGNRSARKRQTRAEKAAHAAENKVETTRTDADTVNDGAVLLWKREPAASKYPMKTTLPQSDRVDRSTLAEITGHLEKQKRCENSMREARKSMRGRTAPKRSSSSTSARKTRSRIGQSKDRSRLNAGHANAETNFSWRREPARVSTGRL